MSITRDTVAFKEQRDGVWVTLNGQVLDVVLVEGNGHTPVTAYLVKLSGSGLVCIVRPGQIVEHNEYKPEFPRTGWNDENPYNVEEPKP